MRGSIPTMSSSIGRKPIVSSTFGVRSKKSGYARVEPGAPSATSVTSLVSLDKRVDRLDEGRSGPTASPTPCRTSTTRPTTSSAARRSATLNRSPRPTRSCRIRVGPRRDHRLQDSDRARRCRRALSTPPATSRAASIRWSSTCTSGCRTACIGFSVPSERDYYNAAAFTTRGYVYLQPDIVFRPREPGLSVIESVVPGGATSRADGRRRSRQGRHHRPLVGRV